MILKTRVHHNEKATTETTVVSNGHKFKFCDYFSDVRVNNFFQKTFENRLPLKFYPLIFLTK